MGLCPQKGYKKRNISLNLINQYSVNAKYLAYSEECDDIGTVVENSTHGFATRTKFSAKIFLVFELVFNATLDFFHNFIGRVATIHNLDLLHIKLRHDYLLLLYFT